MKQISISGTTTTRDDGSTVIPYVYLDANGEVVGKAYVPEGHDPTVPDAVDEARSFPVDSTTDLSTKLADSPANLPSAPTHDPADTAMEKVENIVIDDTYQSTL